jgi:hypothetical protein
MELNTEPRYRFSDNGEFVIDDYHSSKLFSSFFPGIAGKLGMPMWTFYVNRGQCVCSMGVEGKNHPIMEFLPANWAYNLVSTQGFRTFVKLPEHPHIRFYEPFQNDVAGMLMERTQSMIIGPAKLTLREHNHSLGLSFQVEYFNIPQAPYAGLARKLIIRNLNDDPVKLQVLDGLPLIIPYGMDDFGLKHMRRLFEAFVEVNNFEHRVPYYKLKVEPSDRPDVVRIKKGNFYLGFGMDGKLVMPVCDPARIFGIRGDYSYPELFVDEPFEDITGAQVFENRLPCAMGAFETTLAADRAYSYYSIIGHAGTLAELNELVPSIAQTGYIEKKAIENQEIISALTQKNFIFSSLPVLDQYARQNFLDNVMRGGYPHTIKGREGNTTLHLYSRKHGDLERDYNDYRLTPTPYSQGNGNYRDVNQNRRCDLFFNPDVADNNVLQFYNLIQLDGFNPLVIKESRFFIADTAQITAIATQYLGAEHVQKIVDYLQESFTPGEFLLWLKEEHIPLPDDTEHFIGDLLNISARHDGTDHGEGYWVDHWTYNLDLLENYQAVYPDRMRHLLFEKQSFGFYDNPHSVQARQDKYVIWDGKPMQLNAVVWDPEKDSLIKTRKHEPNMLRTDFGKGTIYRTTLFVKLLCLITNKLASLDAAGVGVEMEADKPGWYDALNGMPGLLGSSVCETLEIKRHIIYLLKMLDPNAGLPREIALFEELHSFVRGLRELLDTPHPAFEFWDSSNSLKEEFRAQTRLGIKGTEVSVQTSWILDFLKSALNKLDHGIAKARDQQSGVINTYFINEVSQYEIIKTEQADGSEQTKRNSRGFPCFKALEFIHPPLPLFLEGPVHYLRSNPPISEAAALAKQIRAGALFDPHLRMYKVNESLKSMPMEIGRARTFSPGWFENESIWLHMGYKYMLELLRNKLYDEFFRDFKNVFVPFMNPDVYGRSPLENSSFIVSSANPDPSLHGNGFVARLSGATAEFIHILHLMTVGEQPFKLDSEARLLLQLQPALPGWMFTTKPGKANLFLDGKLEELEFGAGTFSFMFLGEILVSYHNPECRDTFGENKVAPVAWLVEAKDGETTKFQGSTLPSGMAEAVRARQVKRITIELR